MKRLKNMLAVIKPGDTFFARHDDRNVAPSGSEDAVEGRLRHTANLRASHLSERGRHDRARRRTRKSGAAAGPAHPGTPRSHRHCLRLKRAVSTCRSVRSTSQFGHDLFGEKVAWRPLRFGARRKYDLQRGDFGQALRMAGQAQVSGIRAVRERCRRESCFDHAEKAQQARALIRGPVGDHRLFKTADRVFPGDAARHEYGLRYGRRLVVEKQPRPRTAPGETVLGEHRVGDGGGFRARPHVDRPDQSAVRKRRHQWRHAMFVFI